MRNIKIKVDEYELGLMIKALVEYRTQEIKKGNSVDFENEMLEKLFSKIN